MGAPLSNSSAGSPAPLPSPPPPAYTEPAEKSVKRYDCQFCTRSWSNVHSLTRHEATHKGDNDRPHKCGTCDKGFSQRTALVTHSNTHTGKRPHLCRSAGCTSAFGDPSSRTRHEKETHDPSAGFKCINCGDTTKRKEQFKKHIQNMHHTAATDEICASARKYCAETYWTKVEAEGGTRPVQAIQPAQPVVKVDEGDRTPPLRPRRNAVASTSQVFTDPPEYEEEDDSARKISPMSSDYSYFDAATNHARTDSFESTASHPSQYFDGPQDHTFVDTFSRAYTARYDQVQADQFYPSDHTMRYPSGTPEQAPISPEQEEASEALLRYMRNPYRPPVMARGYPMSSPQVSMPSPHIPVPSPQVAMPVPRAPLPTEQSLFAQNNWSAAGSSWFPNDVDAMSRVPRSMSASMHPSMQSRDHLQETRHHPYGRRGHRGHAVQEYLGQPFIAHTPEEDLPMINNGYQGEPRIVSSEPGSPEGMPLPLAGIRERPAAPYVAYEH